MTKRVLITSAGMIITTALLCGPTTATVANATTATTGTAPTAASLKASLDEWTAADRREVAGRARAVGDLEGAAVSAHLAERIEAGSGQHQNGTRNILTTVAKKLILQALRYGVNKLPAIIRPYASKIVNVIEDLNEFQQGTVVLALTKAGVPHDVAVATAQWIVVFIGL
jgi:hypothetical protein